MLVVYFTTDCIESSVYFLLFGKSKQFSPQIFSPPFGRRFWPKWRIFRGDLLENHIFCMLARRRRENFGVSRSFIGKIFDFLQILPTYFRKYFRSATPDFPESVKFWKFYRFYRKKTLLDTLEDVFMTESERIYSYLSPCWRIDGFSVCGWN